MWVADETVRIGLHNADTLNVDEWTLMSLFPHPHTSVSPTLGKPTCNDRFLGLAVNVGLCQ